MEPMQNLIEVVMLREAHRQPAEWRRQPKLPLDKKVSEPAKRNELK